MMQMPAIGFSVLAGEEATDDAKVEGEPVTFCAGEEVAWTGTLPAGPHTVVLQTYQPRTNGQFTAAIFTEHPAREI